MSYDIINIIDDKIIKLSELEKNTLDFIVNCYNEKLNNQQLLHELISNNNMVNKIITNLNLVDLPSNTKNNFYDDFYDDFSFGKNIDLIPKIDLYQFLNTCISSITSLNIKEIYIIILFFLYKDFFFDINIKNFNQNLNLTYKLVYNKNDNEFKIKKNPEDINDISLLSFETFEENIEYLNLSNIYNNIQSNKSIFTETINKYNEIRLDVIRNYNLKLIYQDIFDLQITEEDIQLELNVDILYDKISEKIYFDVTYFTRENFLKHFKYLISKNYQNNIDLYFNDNKFKNK